MKKMIGLMIALTFVLSLLACGGQPATEQKSESGTAAENTKTNTGTDTQEQTSGELTQEQTEEKIIGRWMLSEKDGQPVLTNKKDVIDIISTTKAYVSVSRTVGQAPWLNYIEADTHIKGNVVTISFIPQEEESIEHEFTITDINPNEFTANFKATYFTQVSMPEVGEHTVKYVRVNDEFSKDILGTWEGHCTSKGSAFDDGQNHRWEYKEDGTYVYYEKDNDKWVPGDDSLNEYFVAGSLLCTRWIENGKENREWWEITIDGDTMNWSALREDEDGNTFTVTFEMKKVTE